MLPVSDPCQTQGHFLLPSHVLDDGQGHAHDDGQGHAHDACHPPEG